MNNLLFKLAMLGADTGAWDWVNDITGFLKTLLPYVLIVVATAGTIYAVVLGVKMARAEDASAREEAKKRIINFIIALAITVILILLLQLFANNIGTWLGIEVPDSDIVGGGSGNGSGLIGLLK